MTDAPKVRANRGTVHLAPDDGVAVTHIGAPGDGDGDEAVTARYDGVVLYPAGWAWVEDDDGEALLLPRESVLCIEPSPAPEAAEGEPVGVER